MLLYCCVPDVLIKSIKHGEGKLCTDFNRVMCAFGSKATIIPTTTGEIIKIDFPGEDEESLKVFEHSLFRDLKILLCEKEGFLSSGKTYPEINLK